ncbi:hypothetical protein O3M35_003855 [Rhynocoris fuscipes]|uniref:Transferrin n=1 Tax=Rhynocoris fuscipes TaxID=488301 RepID=A0AAW1CIS0_9HEMI
MASFAILIFIISVNIHMSLAIYKLCAFPTMEYHHCKSIEVGNSNVSCVKVIDSVDCAIKLREGKVDFALFSPEESVLLAKDTNTDLKVIGEVRDKFKVDESTQLSMVAIIRKELSGKFSELRGKKYCHSGVGFSHRLTDHFTTYFERKVVPAQCKSWLTAAEQEVNVLNDFFGDSCRPGVWAQTKSLDRRLKWRYPKLCRLCDSTSQCKYNLDRSNSFEAALQCLTRKSGEVTYVPLHEAKKYFGLFRNSNRQNNADDYVFLCKNETTMPITTEFPCVWGKQPWNYLVTRSDVATDLKALMPDWLTTDNVKDWRSNLRYLLIGRYKSYIHNRAQDPISLSTFLNRGGVDDESNISGCRKSLRWCTLNSVEFEKCNWIGKAASTHGFKPDITCIRGQTILGCLQNIAQNKADIMSIYTEYGYIARRVYNLSTVVFEDNTLDGNYKILAVLKNDNQYIKSFQDMRNKKACFPEYNGLSWLSFINTAKMNDILGKTCADYFFGPSCIPGAYNESFVIPGSNRRPQSMCSICPTPINSTDPCTPSESIDINAMMCLSKGQADFAFVNFHGLLSGGDSKTLNELISPDLYKVMCKNGTIVNGLYVDDDCALSTGINSEVIGRSQSSIDRADIVELLLELDKSFGTIAADEEGGVLRMYDEFKGEKNVLFKDSTVALANSDEDLNYNEVNSYTSMLNNVTDCNNSAHQIILSFHLMLFSILGLFLYQ